MISLETAGQLIDFAGAGRLSTEAAQAQLAGAVALYNILNKHEVAYLADEVGMGKTYVALGTVALFRHFQPNFRILILAPRENIQKKWKKELENFVASNLRFPDLRMKALHGEPARSVVLCDSLLELVTQTTLDPDRDFIGRLPSFSFAFSDDEESVGKKMKNWTAVLPWIDPAAFGRGKADFKDAVARVACCALPVFDLVIVDEGHNLKGGLHERVAARNRVLALAMGHPEGAADPRVFKGYGPRAKRVLFLSATPLEDDYAQLWNQLRVFGKEHVAPELGHHASDPEQEKELREATRRFLIRRVSARRANGQSLTKNQYRRDWRSGGVALFDEPIPEPKDARAQLAVALVQKKVSEVLDAKFGSRFQIGMLASFESFLQTAKSVQRQGEEAPSHFDDVEQTEDVAEREGADVRSIDRLARDYRKRFDAELPHPKMDALVDALAGAFESGDKALVFVRRVASVKELQRKLEDRYDQWLLARLQRELRPELWTRVSNEHARYRRLRAEERDAHHHVGDVEDHEVGGLETFFAHFFRGQGPSGILSGASIAKRLKGASGIQSTFLEDNYAARLLDVPVEAVFDTLVTRVALSPEQVTQELRRRALPFLRSKKLERANVFLALQRAAQGLLAERAKDASIREQAEVMLQLRFDAAAVSGGGGEAPTNPREWLKLSTFWTDLRERAKTDGALAKLWPPPREGPFAARFREEELRRELLSSMARLGSPLIDLYVLIVNSLGSVDAGAREAEEGASDLSSRFLDLLSRQAQSAQHSSYSELCQASEQLELILDVNLPRLRAQSLDQVARELGSLLRNQSPVGGMFGGINETLVRQFRMPGYPQVLISTDLLQEGEDLHTFCSRVFHYGISWMPSSMEQRVGRVDRVNSAIDRRLSQLTRPPTGEDKLQVHYPYLAQTVEVLQVQTVLSRIDRFMQMMHRDLGTPEVEQQRHVDIGALIHRVARVAPPDASAPLQSAFEIAPWMIRAAAGGLAAGPEVAAGLRARFEGLARSALPGLEIRWEKSAQPGALLGTIALGVRSQPFTLLVQTFQGDLLVRCVSPVGVTLFEDRLEAIAEAARTHPVRITTTYRERFDSYDLAVEADVLLRGPAHDAELVAGLIRQVTVAADELEQVLLDVDEPMATFEADLKEETRVPR